MYSLLFCICYLALCKTQFNKLLANLLQHLSGLANRKPVAVFRMPENQKDTTAGALAQKPTFFIRTPSRHVPNN